MSVLLSGLFWKMFFLSRFGAVKSLQPRLVSSMLMSFIGLEFALVVSLSSAQYFSVDSLCSLGVTLPSLEGKSRKS